MALTNVEIVWPPRYQGPVANVNFRYNELDSNPTMLAIGFQAGKTGNLEEIELYIDDIFTDESIDLSLQRPNSSGLPDGTAITNGSITVASGTLVEDSFNAFTFATAPAVVEAEYYWLVLEWTSTVGNIEFGFLPVQSNSNFPFLLGWNGSSWAAQDNSSGLAARFKYTDNTYPYNPVVASANLKANTAYSVGTASGHRKNGIRFKTPFRGRLKGLMMVMDHNASGVGAPSFNLFDDADDASGTGTELHQIGDIGGGEDDMYLKSTGSSAAFIFTTKPIIEADTWYRLAMIPNSVTVLQSFYDDFEDSKYKMQQFNTEDFMTTYTTDNSTWINDDTTSLMWMLIFDQVDLDDGGGGGGSVIIPRSRNIQSI